ncbi:MAG: hypothetical protein ACE5R6_15420 [Candidatus Heimdallarchaeota archaeon]
MIEPEALLAALATLTKLVQTNPDEAFKRVKTDLTYGLIAFKPQETLKITGNVQLYVKRLETAQQDILQGTIDMARLNYTEGFILASLVSFYRQWNMDADLEGELPAVLMRLEDLMRSTENEFIRKSSRNAIRDMQEMETYLYERSEFFYPFLIRYYSSGFNPEYILDLLSKNELSESKIIGFLLAIYRNNRYLRSKLQELVGADQLSPTLLKILEGLEKFSERANRKDLRDLAAHFVRIELKKQN